MNSGGNQHTGLPDGRSEISGLARGKGARSPIGDASQEVYLNLIRTAACLSAPFEALFKSHGITHPQYNAMRILRGHSAPVSSSTVSRQMLTREPDITRLLGRLVDAGYVERERSEQDRREVLSVLTADGHALLAELDDPVREIHEHQLSHMSESELGTMIELLERARDNCPRCDSEAQS